MIVLHRRNRLSVMLLVWTLSGATATSQQSPAPTADPASPVLTFSGDAAVITVLIKPEKTADFDYVLSRLKEALKNSEKSERQAQAAGWKVFKASQLAQGSVVYVMHIDPVVKGQEYDITRLIAEVFPGEVQDLFVKYKDAFVGRGITELTAFMSMQ